MILKKTVYIIKLILLGLMVWWFSRLAFLHFNHPQEKNEVYIRDDFVSETICDVLNGKTDPDTILFEITSKLSAWIYQDYSTKTDNIVQIDNWRLLLESEKSWEWYELSRLKYAVWIRDDKKIAIIVFKGSNSLFDWHSNLHWLFKYLRIVEDQYEQVPLAVLDIEKELNKYPGIVTYSTGHSLGGGLAQHALYRSKKISKAFAFNSSPATGWHDVDDISRKKNTNDTQIYRLHENGEALEFLRLLMKAEYLFGPSANDNPYFKEYRFNMLGGGIFSQHEIGPISEYLEAKKSKCVAK